MNVASDIMATDVKDKCACRILAQMVVLVNHDQMVFFNVYAHQSSKDNDVNSDVFVNRIRA